MKRARRASPFLLDGTLGSKCHFNAAKTSTMSATTSQSRQRSQRKASSLATAAITLQSSSDDHGRIGRGATQQQTQQQTHLLANRALTIKERQQLEEEDAERRDRERSSKRRKVQRRLDELERTNPKDPLGGTSLGSSSSSSAATNRNDGEAFSIPNSAVAAAVTRAYEGIYKSDDQHQSPSGTPIPVPIKRSIGGPASTSSGASTTATHPTVRRLILYRRNLHTLLDTAMQTSDVFKAAPHNYLSASSVAEKARLVKAESNRQRRVMKKFKGSDSKAKALVAASEATSSFMTVVRRPIFCTICGDSGEVNCPRCGDRTCVRGACLETHNDTRCDRPIR